jgi:hypothetical protein
VQRNRQVTRRDTDTAPCSAHLFANTHCAAAFTLCSCIHRPVRSPQGRHVPFTAPHQRLQATHSPVRLVQFLQYESGHSEHSPSAVA